jgi:hypothetical protein
MAFGFMNNTSGPRLGKPAAPRRAATGQNLPPF